MQLRPGTSLADQLSPEIKTVVLVSSQREQRALWIEEVKQYWIKQEPLMMTIRFTLPEEARSFHEELHAQYLWRKPRLLIADMIDPSHVPGVASSEKSQDLITVFGVSSWKSRPLGEHVAVLDISQEKPWDREARVESWISSRISHFGKQITREATRALRERFDNHPLTLEQEIQKLLLYLGGETSSVDLDAINAVCSSGSNTTTGWQLAEQIVWMKPIALEGSSVQGDMFFPFIGQLRYHLQTGAVMAGLEKQDIQELHHYLPNVRPQYLKQYAPVARRRSCRFFTQGLIYLYDLEITMKSSKLQPTIAFDYFQAHLYENIAPSS